MPFNAVIRTSGIIMVDSRDEVAITAGTSGIVEFTDHFLFPGVKVKKGTPLFTLSGKNITGNSRDVEFARAEAGYIKAKADMQRADSLIGLKLITAEHYNTIKNEFSVATALYNSYRSNSGSSFTRVVSPHEGFVREITVREGELVEAGRILAVLTIRHNMILKADIPHTMMHMAEEITGARFSPGYSEEVYSIDEMGGSILSYGRSTGDNSFYIPVYFNFEFNDDLIPGSFADVWLLGRTIEDALVVPNIAILEDYGKKYLLIETREGLFEKRYFTPGATDGIHTIAENGLSGGEVIVSEGAYQIKMSLNSSAPAAHTH
jgi:RND family efflux transporter MFP subunit